MRLFETIEPSENLLPYDGAVHYFGTIVRHEDATRYLQYLLDEIAWQNDEAFIFGKHYITKRKVAWYADKPYTYRYSNKDRTALPWTDTLLRLKALAEQYTNATYNSCLLNLYHDGSEGMAWHSDDETDLKTNGSIASLSFGATRKFAFKHRKTKETVAILLDTGSLLEMKDETQDHWVHRLPPTKKVHHPRVNLTFRQMVAGQSS